MYRTVEQAVTAMLAKYEVLTKAIQRAQQYAHKAKQKNPLISGKVLKGNLRNLNQRNNSNLKTKEE